MKRDVSVFLLILFMLVTSAAATAESVRRDSGGGDDSRRAQLMMRQLSQAKAQLEADNARMAGELKALQAKVTGLESELGKTSKTLVKSKSSNQQLVTRVKDDNRKMQLLMEKYRNSVQLLRMEKANVNLLKLAVEERNQWIDKCKASNESMYQVNSELVDRYQNKGFWQELAQSDPLTGLGDVKMEVIAEDYRYRLDDLQVAKFKPANDTAGTGDGQ